MTSIPQFDWAALSPEEKAKIRNRIRPICPHCQRFVRRAEVRADEALRDQKAVAFQMDSETWAAWKHEKTERGLTHAQMLEVAVSEFDEKIGQISVVLGPPPFSRLRLPNGHDRPEKLYIAKPGSIVCERLRRLATATWASVSVVAGDAALLAFNAKGQIEERYRWYMWERWELEPDDFPLEPPTRK